MGIWIFENNVVVLEIFGGTECRKPGIRVASFRARFQAGSLPSQLEVAKVRYFKILHLSNQNDKS
jgi:hypothetical protein